MDIDEYLRRTPPRSLSELRPVLVSESGDEVTWRLRCACGSERGTILGHPLGDLKTGFEGSEFMVSPFSFRCADCARVTGFLDTDIHGEGGEFKMRDGLEFGCAAYRGEGEPTPAACPHCQGQVVRGVATVTYHDDRIEDWEENPSFPLADFFNWFRLDCTCSGCGHAWELTTIDTKI
ncbi:MAG TPA: hypothetical protein VGE74_05520 [Gemmata sp.]